MLSRRMLAFGLMTSVSVVLANAPYLGVGIGINHLSDTVTYSDLQIPTNNGTANFSNNSPIGTAFAGYGIDFYSQWVAGIEFFGLFQNTHTSIYKSGEGKATFKQASSYGIRLVPSYLIVPTADIHALIGYTRTLVNVLDNGGFIAPVPDWNNYLQGFQVGLGTSLTMGYGFILRADMIYNGYANFTNHRYYDNPTLPTLDYLTYKNSFNDLMGLVSLAYAF